MADAPTVDSYVNCWEGSYRELLAPGVLGNHYGVHSYPFARRVLTINNVADRHDVVRLADQAIARGECDAYLFVADELPQALQRCGLRIEDIQPVIHFVDFLLVVVSTGHSDYVLHVADDVRITRPFDWISDALRTLQGNQDFLIANPDWSLETGKPIGGAKREALRFEAPYWIGFGFSDQCFLGSRQRLAAPIYGEWNKASNRYPMSHVGRIFEARVDAYMRNHDLLRISDSRLLYDHVPYHSPGHSHPRGSLGARLLRFSRRAAAAVRRRTVTRLPRR
jgi:hypothetical protein